MDDSIDRKNRLKELRNRAKMDAVTGAASSVDEEPSKRIRFRNYEPQRQPEIQNEPRRPQEPQLQELPTLSNANESVESVDIIKRELNLLESTEINIVPKHPNW